MLTPAVLLLSVSAGLPPVVYKKPSFLDRHYAKLDAIDALHAKGPPPPDTSLRLQDPERPPPPPEVQVDPVCVRFQKLASAASTSVAELDSALHRAPRPMRGGRNFAEWKIIPKVQAWARYCELDAAQEARLFTLLEPVHRAEQAELTRKRGLPIFEQAITLPWVPEERGGPCKQGGEPACVYDGVDAYHRGEVSRSYQLWNQACLRRQALGCLDLALYHLNGWGGHVDPSRASTQLFRACDADSAAACNVRGMVHERGHVVARSLESATTAFAKACKLGSTYGCAARDRAQATWDAERAADEAERSAGQAAREAAEAAKANAQPAVPFSFDTGSGREGVFAGWARHLRVWRLYCREKDKSTVVTCRAALEDFQKAGAPKAQIAQVLDALCDLEDGPSCVALGHLLREHEHEQAYFVFRRACYKGQAEGCAAACKPLDDEMCKAACLEHGHEPTCSKACGWGYEWACQREAPAAEERPAPPPGSRRRR